MKKVILLVILSLMLPVFLSAATVETIGEVQYFTQLRGNACYKPSTIKWLIALYDEKTAVTAADFMPDYCEVTTGDGTRLDIADKEHVRFNTSSRVYGFNPEINGMIVKDNSSRYFKPILVDSTERFICRANDYDLKAFENYFCLKKVWVSPDKKGFAVLRAACGFDDIGLIAFYDEYCRLTVQYRCSSQADGSYSTLGGSFLLNSGVLNEKEYDKAQEIPEFTHYRALQKLDDGLYCINKAGQIAWKRSGNFAIQEFNREDTRVRLQPDSTGGLMADGIIVDLKNGIEIKRMRLPDGYLIVRGRYLEDRCLAYNLSERRLVIYNIQKEKFDFVLDESSAFSSRFFGAMLQPLFSSSFLVYDRYLVIPVERENGMRAFSVIDTSRDTEIHYEEFKDYSKCQFLEFDKDLPYYAVMVDMNTLRVYRVKQ